MSRFNQLSQKTAHTASGLLVLLRDIGLLTVEQQRQLASMPSTDADGQALAKELVRRGWLTKFQANELCCGRGPALGLGLYVLLERLGEGGMGEVFKARHRIMNRLVAIKLIRKEMLNSAEAVRRFKREIEVVAKLNHPNIVLAHDAGYAGERHYLALELVEGADLASLVRQRGALPIGQACDCIRQAALGLQHAHEQGLVHRDIKPTNLLLSNEGVLKLLDLGLARPRFVEVESLSQHELTRTGMTGGTPDYLAPEQALDLRKADIRSDLYSLGCTFYFLLTGRPPFPEGSLAQKLLWSQQTEPEAIEFVRPDVPREIGEIVRRLMAKRPEDRYQTPADVAAALAPFSGGNNGAMSANASTAPSQSNQTTFPNVPERGWTLITDPTAPPFAPRQKSPVNANDGVAESGDTFSPALHLDQSVPAENLQTSIPVVGLTTTPGAAPSPRPHLVQGRRSRYRFSLFPLSFVFLLACSLATWFYSSLASLVPATNKEPVASAKDSPPNPAPAVGKKFPDPVASAKDSPPNPAPAVGKKFPDPGVKVLPLKLATGVTMELVRIEPGSFLMGGVQGNPVHTVKITRPFYLGKYPVTQAEFVAIMNFNPSYFHDNERLPVETVSWENTQEFCQRLSGIVGHAVRLPTEAEWEFACRAGTTTAYWSGNTEADLARVDWYEKNSGGKTHPVGEKPANPWGLCEMHGNVWQWCQDPGRIYKKGEVLEDPKGDPGGKDILDKYRAMRGGSWFINPWDNRSGGRGSAPTDYRRNYIGFRVLVRLE